MCGIGGILRVWPADQRELALRTPHAGSIPEEWLNILDDSIRHRGPDGQGRFRDRALRADGCVVDVAFVHRRLSIIDHAGGAQPMVSVLPRAERDRDRDGSSSAQASGVEGFPLLFHGKPNAPVEYRSIAPADTSTRDVVAVVFNGCIYNHRELRAELQRAGHEFTTDHSDTEVLVHGWRHLGRSLWSRLDSMHALAIWDSSRGRLTLRRDEFGEKPLWASADDRGLWAFSSAAAGLHRLLASAWSPIGQSLGADVSSIVGFGFQLEGRVDKQPRCIRHATALEIWGPTLADRTEYPPYPQARERVQDATPDQIERALFESVRERLDADVPVGCFLSGGVDSSLIACAAKQAVGRVSTFTVRMPDERFDESRFAERVAAHIGTDHTTIPCDPRPAENLRNLIEQTGFPLGDSSLLPTFWVSKAARSMTSVALGGDGGDELFVGYERYEAAALLERGGCLFSLIPRWLLRSSDPKSWPSRLERLQHAGVNGYLDLVAIFRWQELGQLNAAWGPQPDCKYRIVSIHGREQAVAWDLENYLPLDILPKADMASMSVALELRSPMLDRQLSTLACGATIRSLLPNNQRKGLLRQVARKYFPAEIVDRPKMGFAIPIGEWFRSDYGGLRTMLLDHLNSTEPFGPPSLGIDLNMKFIRRMLDEHLGTGPSGRIKRDHAQRLYMLLVLSIWAKWLAGLKSSL